MRHQRLFSRLHAVDARRLRESRSWVVSFWILSSFGPRRYEPVDDAEECAYIKLVNVGDKVITRRCGGYLTSQLGFYLGNVHIQPRRIWLALHGESQLQVESRRVGAATGTAATESG